MDNKCSGLADWFLAKHTRDPVLQSQLLSNRETSTSQRPTGRVTEITRNIICGNCRRQKYVSSLSLANTDFSNGLSTPISEQCALEACASVEARVLREREEREQFESEIERKEREIREQRARRRREREARELEEARRWPQEQEAVTVPWCACRHEGEETAQGSDALSEPQQETYPTM